MQSKQDMVLAFVAFNILAFVVVGMWLFDARAARTSFSLFAGMFATVTLFTLGYLYWYPTSQLVLQLAAMALLSVSLLLFVLATLTMMRHSFSVIFSADSPSRIVTHGVYAYIRHPFYTAYILTFVGAAAGSAHAVPSLCAVIVAVLYGVAALVEENKFARSEFAQAYRLYRRQTGMFWPWRSNADLTSKRNIP